MNNTDKEYFRLINTVLTNGRVKKNRTGIDTIGVFGEQAKFNIDLNAFPILTTKKVWMKGIIHELLWFIKGDTNIKYLVDNDVHIWDEWAYKRFFDSYESHHLPYSQDVFIKTIKTDDKFAAKWGELGEGTYGGMWRDFPHFNQTYKNLNNTGVGDEYERTGIDQLQKVIDKLKTNPDDRRIIVSAWHPYWVDHCSLPPCHCLFQFHTEELTIDERRNLYIEKGGDLFPMAECDLEKCFDTMDVPKRRLNCQLYIRSQDIFLGCPFNITSYALLTAMIAHCSNMATGTYTHTMGDTHIYFNHIEQCKLQLSREPMKLPKLWLNPEVKSLFDFKYDDIKLIDYNSHPTIKADVAV